MSGSMFLCLGSTLAALFGLLVLGWGARQRRWPLLWVLIAALFLIGAGLGAAETVYQIAAEREDAPQQTPISAIPATPLPEREQLPTVTTSPFPTATTRPTPISRLEAAGESTPTARPTPQASESSPREQGDVAPREQGDVAPREQGDVALMAPSLISSERDVLRALDDPPHYLLNVTVDFDALTVAGSAEIRYTNNEQDALAALYLRLYPNASHYQEAETVIDDVKTNGATAGFSFEDPERTILKVPLSTPLAPEERITVHIDFAVTVPRRSDRFGYDRGVMSLGHWYPMLAVYDDEGWNLDPYVALGDAFYSDVALFTVQLTVPEGTVVAASGVELGQALHREGRVTMRLASGATRDFALALSRAYQTVSAQIGETTVTSYYLPGHEQGGRRVLQVASEALEVYNTLFGRYPYTELDVAETSFTVMGAPGGMEFPGILFISTELYHRQGLFASELDVIVAHEVAHQWWYGVVGNNQVDEPWLDEAFATYASILYIEEQQDPVAAQSALLLQAVLPYQLVQMIGQDGPLQSSLLDYGRDLVTYQSLIYGKGALFLDKLRELLGDDLFFTVLQHHYQSHKYGLLAPGDFRRSLQEALTEADEERRSEAMALYAAVVVRGEPIQGVSGLDGLGGLLGEELSPEDLEGMMQLLEELLQDLER